MGKRLGHVARWEAGKRRLPPKTSVSAAVLFALYGLPYSVEAQQQSANSLQQTESPSATLQEVVVTATRRAESLEAVPYSISVVNAEQIANTGVTDLASLASQVPGLSVFDFGARLSGSSFPIIRGLNAASPPSGVTAGFRAFQQAPVGTYIGNSPIDGYFQLDDVQQVEVLRGPQGTLYGAGALGGALRIIPNAPELGKFAGSVEAGGGALAHSSGASYTTSAMLNIPIGDVLAFRVSGKYAYEPGFIDVYGILKQNGPPISGIPVLANPADPVNSPGVFTSKNDWNDQNTFTGRASLLWKPVDEFNAEAAFTYSNVNGDGGPVADPAFAGGPYPIDSRITLPQGSDYRDFNAVNQPYSRRTTLESLDLSYDAGFATLSSTSSYFTTTGSTVTDSTYAYIGENATLTPGYAQYYAGDPINPRFVGPQLFADSAHTFTQEVRLVSTAGPDKQIDYVLGVFYENQEREGSWAISEPGTPERSVAQGCTAPYYIGASFPNCLIVTGPNDLNFFQQDTQEFVDKSVFGELTWHFLKNGQITFGGRHFEQSFTDSQSYALYTFGIDLPPIPRSAPASKNTWKINPSYEYATDQYVYALWSQGFRRGGANAFPTQSFFHDNPALLTYRPDSVNNYETGIKGRFGNGMRYTFDVFDDEWSNPQIQGVLPDGNIAVWNAIKARSRGVEFDLQSPLFLPGLSILVGGTYADATLTRNFFYEADIAGNIYGKAGQQLPGSAKTSAAATINYERNIAAGYNLTLSLNDTYRSAMVFSTYTTTATPTIPVTSGMDIVNVSAWVKHESWRLGLLVTNVTDKRAILDPGIAGPGDVNKLFYEETINQPREISVRLGYSF
jgi:iron complex outermembrane receptor protein